MTATVSRYAEADVPTEYGVVRTVVYRVGDTEPPTEHIALVVGDVASGDAPVLARVLGCWTGRSCARKCDCRDQLDLALARP